MDQISLTILFAQDWCYKRELVGKEDFLCKVVPRIPRLEVLRLSECRVSARTLERISERAGASLLRLQLRYVMLPYC